MARSEALTRHGGKGARQPSLLRSLRKKEGGLKGRALEEATKRVTTLRKQGLFLKGYIKAGTITDGAAAARVSRQTHYDWFEADEAYARAFEAAKEESIEGLEAECRRRALSRSDILLIFLMKAGRPNVYRDRWEGKLDTTSIIAPMTPAMLKHMSTDELEQARVLFRKMLGQK